MTFLTEDLPLPLLLIPFINVDISLTQVSFWLYIKYLPGHGRVLHGCESLLFPTQPLPPFAGWGLLQVRDRVLIPPSHLLLQADQGFHCCQPPWTGISKIRIYEHKAISMELILLINYGVTERWWKTCVAFVGVSANIWKFFRSDEDNKVLWRLFPYRNE